MSEIGRIIDQMQRAFTAEAWCGSSLHEALADVTAERAAAKPLAAAHSMWEIVLHIAAWKGAIKQRLAGQYVTLPVEGDWPPVTDVSDLAWAESLARLDDRQEELMKVVRGINDNQLDETLQADGDRESGGGVSRYVTLHGITQHDLYHAAQIALLKKV